MDYNPKEDRQHKHNDEEKIHNNLIYQRNLIELEKLKVYKEILKELKENNKTKSSSFIFGGF